MRSNTLITTLVACLVMTACSAATPASAPQPAVEKDTPQAAMPPPGASAKVSAEMAAKISPVPAFMGGGEHWHIDIKGAGEMRHEVTLSWAMGEKKAAGELFYRDAPGVPHQGPIALDGTLDIAGAAKTIRVEIIPEACTDDADVAHAQRVKVAVQGEAEMTGCGDLAVY